MQLGDILFENNYRLENPSEHRLVPALPLIATFCAEQKTYFPTKELHWEERKVCQRLILHKIINYACDTHRREDGNSSVCFGPDKKQQECTSESNQLSGKLSETCETFAFNCYVYLIFVLQCRCRELCHQGATRYKSLQRLEIVHRAKQWTRLILL